MNNRRSEIYATEIQAVWALRQALGLTQQQMAFHFGCSISSVVRWEAGARIALPYLVKFAKAADDRNWIPIREAFLELAAERFKVALPEGVGMRLYLRTGNAGEENAAGGEQPEKGR